MKMEESSKDKKLSGLDGVILRVLQRSTLSLRATQIVRHLRHLGVRTDKAVVNRRLQSMLEAELVGKDSSYHWCPLQREEEREAGVEAAARDEMLDDVAASTDQPPTEERQQPTDDPAQVDTSESDRLPESFRAIALHSSDAGTQSAGPGPDESSEDPDLRSVGRLAQEISSHFPALAIEHLRDPTRASRLKKQGIYLVGHLEPFTDGEIASWGLGWEFLAALRGSLSKLLREIRNGSFQVPEQSSAHPQPGGNTRNPRKRVAKESGQGRPESLSKLAREICSYMPLAEISVLPGLNQRLENVLHNHSVRRISHLIDFTDTDVASWRGIGKTSLNRLRTSLERLLKACREGNPEPRNQSFAAEAEPEGPTQPLLSLLTDDFDERELEILDRRILRVDSQATLEELGGDFDVTRERIRQIENKIEKRLRSRLRPRIAGLDRKIEEIRGWLNFPLTVSTLEQRLQALQGFRTRPEYFARLLDIAESRHAVLFLDGVDEPIVTSRKANDAEALTEEIEKRIRGSNLTRMSQISELVAEILSEKEAEELWPVAMALVDGALVLEAGLVFSPRTTDLVTAVVAAAARPLRVEEIHTRLRQAGQKVTLTAVRGATDRAKDLYLVGPATFSSRSRLVKWEGLKSRIFEAVLELIGTAPDRQWSDEELATHVRDRGIAGEEFDRYAARFLLESCEELQYLRRGVWALKKSSWDHRIPIRDFAVRILEKAGAPLKEEILEKRVKELRPLGKTGINIGWPLAFVASGVVGLVGRDLGLTDEKRRILLGRLQGYSPESPASPEELEAIWREIAPEAPRVAGRYLARALDSNLVDTSGSPGSSDGVEVRATSTESQPSIQEVIGTLKEGTPVGFARGSIERVTGRECTDTELKARLERNGLTIRGDEVVRM